MTYDNVCPVIPNKVVPKVTTLVLVESEGWKIPWLTC